MRGRQGRLFAAAVFSAVFLAGGVIVASGPAYARDASAVQGVAPWQAQRAIDDYINRFVAAQKAFGRAKFGSNDFSVRVKVEGLTRVYNKDLGAIWVAQFSGAILPKVYNSNAEQGYAHAILKIYFDKKNGVQVVVNEGQGVWTMNQKTSILYDDLPEKWGGWKDWGGPGDPPEPPNETANPIPSQDHQYQNYPPSSGSSGAAGDQKIRALAAKVAALGDKVANLKKLGPSRELKEAQDAWQAATAEYYAAVNDAAKRK